MSRGKRYDTEAKLNYQKVFAVIIAIAVVIMFIFIMKNVLKEREKITKDYEYFALYANNKWGVINQDGEQVIIPSYQEMIVIPNKEKDVFICTFNIDETTGTYSQQNIGYYTYIGGLVGYAQSSTIQNSGSFITISVTLSNNNGDKYIGAIAGMLSVQGGVACVVTNCYCPQYNEEQKASFVTADLVVEVRTYGEATGVTITSCYKKEQ